MATCDPQALLDSAACFDCLSPGLKRVLELQLLCEILNSGGGGGGGTVTSVSVTTANGVSATVTNPTTTPALSFTLGAIVPASVKITGTAGAGYAEFVPQSVAPAAPASGYRKFADGTGRMAWIRQSDGYIRTFDSTLTANRVYTFPDATITLAGLEQAQTWTALQTFQAGLETRNGATGTKITIFKTYTSASSYEGLQIDGGVKTASEFSISTVVGGGGGTQRALAIYGGAGLWLESVASNVTLNASGACVFRAGGSNRINVTTTQMSPQSPNAMDLGASGSEYKSIYLATSAIMSSAATIAWNADTIILRDAANTLAQRNSTTAQRLKVYNTYNGVNDEWLDIDWITSSNKLRFGTNKSGGATTRVLEVIVGGTAAAQWDSSGNFYAATNNGQSCGISGQRWNSVWAQTKVQIGASAADVILTGEASGVLQLGVDAGTPAAQRIKAFDGSGSNIAGSDLEACGGQGTGTGVGGSFIVKTAPAGSSGSSANAYVSQLIITGAGDFQVPKTITAAGTTGAQTINKPQGSVNFAAAATSLVVTNSLVTANSVIMLTIAANDATMKSVSYVPASGSFTIYANAAATAETRVNFRVLN